MADQVSDSLSAGGGARRGRLIIGLMSGTSHDGVDAALTVVSGSGRNFKATLLHHTHINFGKKLRLAIAGAFDGTTKDICRLNFDLGEIFARAALMCAAEAGVKIQGVDAVASHGQTICHLPPMGKKRGSTLQIGEPAVIARRTGVPVVSNFRAADIAEGGEGAPLVPLADYLLFRSDKAKAVLNIGGMANVTVVTPELQDAFAFDTGPGNALIDDAMAMLYGRSLDRGGRTARSGKPDARLLRELSAHPYFKRKPPKSTGRETFGREMTQKIIKRHSSVKGTDLLCTFSHLTALAVGQAFEKFICPRTSLEEVVITGGGAKNAFLVELLGHYLPGLGLRPIEDFGIPAEAKEALSFAILANETLSGRYGNLTSVTGASKAVRLGSITYP